MRHKGQPKPSPTVKTLGRAAGRRILAGEPWLRVWSQQLAVPLSTVARKSGISHARLILLECEFDEPTPDEIQAIANGLGTTVELIVEVQS